MNHLVVITGLIVALLCVLPAHAGAGGSCHFHGSKPATEATVTECATQRRAMLVHTGKLDASWKDVAPHKAEVVEGAKGKEWKVTLVNAAVADQAKATLYMFFTLQGNFIAANFTGQ